MSDDNIPTTLFGYPIVEMPESERPSHTQEPLIVLMPLRVRIPLKTWRDELVKKLSQPDPEQQIAFRRIWFEKVKQDGRDSLSSQWLAEAIAAYERRTGREL